MSMRRTNLHSNAPQVLTVEEAKKSASNYLQSFLSRDFQDYYFSKVQPYESELLAFFDLEGTIQTRGGWTTPKETISFNIKISLTDGQVVGYTIRDSVSNRTDLQKRVEALEHQVFRGK